MFSNKFSRLMLGLYGRTRSVVCGAVQSGAGRSGFSWTAVCKQRSLRLRSNGCPEMQSPAVSLLAQLPKLQWTLMSEEVPVTGQQVVG
ncbi:hypothetical protein INR49_026691 [Caranx melampygus]|nr:hypothetical protein INR49_026691 [Caranx melampygus]